MDRILDIHGFQERTAAVFVKGIPGYLKWLKRSGLKAASLEETKVKATSSTLKGVAVGFTGFRDKDLALRIEQAGGVVTNGVTRETTVLVVPSSSFTSSKVDKAHATNITVMPVQLFLKKYKLG